MNLFDYPLAKSIASCLHGLGLDSFCSLCDQITTFLDNTVTNSPIPHNPTPWGIHASGTAVTLKPGPLAAAARKPCTKYNSYRLRKSD